MQRLMLSLGDILMRYNKKASKILSDKEKVNKELVTSVWFLSNRQMAGSEKHRNICFFIWSTVKTWNSLLQDAVEEKNYMCSSVWASSWKKKIYSQQLNTNTELLVQGIPELPGEDPGQVPFYACPILTLYPKHLRFSTIGGCQA